MKKINMGLSKSRKILKRGLYEVMWGAKPHNYKKKLKTGRY